MPIAYISGPMSGLPERNYPEFNRAAAFLRAHGFEVENPAETPDPACGTQAGFMRVAIGQILKVTVNVQLPGWEKSTGAVFEKHMCDVLNIPSIPYIEACQLCAVPRLPQYCDTLLCEIQQCTLNYGAWYAGKTDMLESDVKPVLRLSKKLITLGLVQTIASEDETLITTALGDTYVRVMLNAGSW